MIYKWIWCILGIHRYTTLGIYSYKNKKWFKLTRCSVCKKEIKG